MSGNEIMLTMLRISQLSGEDKKCSDGDLVKYADEHTNEHGSEYRRHTRAEAAMNLQALDHWYGSVPAGPSIITFTYIATAWSGPPTK